MEQAARDGNAAADPSAGSSIRAALEHSNA
jgi:hypothetical protein